MCHRIWVINSWVFGGVEGARHIVRVSVHWICLRWWRIVLPLSKYVLYIGDSFKLGIAGGSRGIFESMGD